MAECQLPKLNTRVRFPSPAPKRGYKKDVSKENPDFIGVFTVLYGKISANSFDRYKNDIFPLLDVLNGTVKNYAQKGLQTPAE